MSVKQYTGKTRKTLTLFSYDWDAVEFAKLGGQWPHLHAIAARLDHSAAAQAAIKAEGLGPAPFTDPQYPNPPEGSVT